MHFFPTDLAGKAAQSRLGDFFASSRASADTDFSALLFSQYNKYNTQDISPSQAKEHSALVGERHDYALAPVAEQSLPGDTGAYAGPGASEAQHPPQSSTYASQPEYSAQQEEKSAKVYASAAHHAAPDEQKESGPEKQTASQETEQAIRQTHPEDQTAGQAHPDAQPEQVQAMADADEQVSSQSATHTHDTAWADMRQHIESVLSALHEVIDSLDVQDPKLQSLKERIADKITSLHAQIQASQNPGTQATLRGKAVSATGKAGVSAQSASPVLAEANADLLPENGLRPERIKGLTSALKEIRQGVLRLNEAVVDSSNVSSAPAAKIAHTTLALLDRVAHLEERLRGHKQTGVQQDATGPSFGASHSTSRNRASRQGAGSAKTVQSEKSVTANLSAAEQQKTKTSGLQIGAESASDTADSMSRVVQDGPGPDKAVQAGKDTTPEALSGAPVKKSMEEGRSSMAMRVKDEGLAVDQPLLRKSGQTEESSGAENVLTTRAGERSAATSGQQTQSDARHGFFQDKRSDAPLKQAASSTFKTTGADVTATSTFGSGQQTEAAMRKMDAPANLAKNAEVYKQVEQGAFKNLGQGTRQLTLRLDPIELGQVSVVLQVRGKEVQAVLRTTTVEASQALNEQMAQLRTQLENEGLKVTRLEVQTQLSDSQTNAQWQGAEQHNKQQENRDLAMTAQRFRSLGRVGNDLAQDVQDVEYPEKNSATGVDIFA